MLITRFLPESLPSSVGSVLRADRESGVPIDAHVRWPPGLPVGNDGAEGAAPHHLPTACIQHRLTTSPEDRRRKAIPLPLLCKLSIECHLPEHTSAFPWSPSPDNSHRPQRDTRTRKRRTRIRAPHSRRLPPRRCTTHLRSDSLLRLDRRGANCRGRIRRKGLVDRRPQPPQARVVQRPKARLHALLNAYASVYDLARQHARRTA